MVHIWANDYLKYDGHDVETVHIFLSGCGETNKSHLMKVIYNTISKTLTYHCKDPEKPRVLLLGPTGISAVNIGRTIIHSGFGINPGPNVLIDKSKAALNYKLFINLLNKIRVGNIDDDVENLLKARFINQSDENYSKDTLHMYEENEPAMKKNKVVLNNLPGELYTIQANGKVSDDCKYPLALIKAAWNKKTNARFTKVSEVKS